MPKYKKEKEHKKVKGVHKIKIKKSKVEVIKEKSTVSNADLKVLLLEILDKL